MHPNVAYSISTYCVSTPAVSTKNLLKSVLASLLAHYNEVNNLGSYNFKIVYKGELLLKLVELKGLPAIHLQNYYCSVHCSLFHRAQAQVQEENMWLDK